MLWEEEASEALLAILIPGQLQVQDGSALILRDPDGGELGEGGEGVREVWQLVAHQGEDGQVGETRHLAGQLRQLVVAEGQ